MKVLLPFLILVMVASVWEVRRDKPPRALPLLGLSVFVAAALFTAGRLM